MKKLLTLVVALGVVLGSLGSASAIDVKVNGQWWFWYSYASNPMLVDKGDTGKHADRTRARQRTRVQIQFIASENLSALLNLENNIHWGNNVSSGSGANNSYGAINADDTTFGVKRAHLDWTIPNTQVKTRMGVQGIALPGFAISSNPVLDQDVAGITVSNQFTPEIGLTVFWARPYDRTYYDKDTQSDGKNELDEMDVFGVILPIKTDVIRVSPWAMFAVIGKDSGFYDTSYGSVNADGIYSVTTGYGGLNKGSRNHAAMSDDSQAYGYWGGASLELPILDPFFVKIDAMYGKVDAGNSDYDISGWLAAAEVGYKFSWGSVSALGFYSSGNEGDDDYGQLPVIGNANSFNFSNAYYGMGGNAWRRYDTYISGTGQGMWGAGLKIADVSFVDNLKHTLAAMWYGGTNDGDAIVRRTPGAVAGGGAFSERQLSTSDHAWEVNLSNEYKVDANLSFRFDIGYIQLELGDSWNDKGDTKGNLLTGIGVQYMF